MGDAARKTPLESGDALAGGDVYSLEAYAVARDVLEQLRNTDRLDSTVVVAEDPCEHASLDVRTAKWKKIFSVEVSVDVPASHKMPEYVAELDGRSVSILVAMRAMQLHPVAQKDRITLKDTSQVADVSCGTLLGKCCSTDVQASVSDFEAVMKRSTFQGSALERMLDFVIFQQSYDVPANRNSEITLEVKQNVGVLKSTSDWIHYKW